MKKFNLIENILGKQTKVEKLKTELKEVERFIEKFQYFLDYPEDPGKRLSEKDYKAKWQELLEEYNGDTSKVATIFTELNKNKYRTVWFANVLGLADTMVAVFNLQKTSFEKLKSEKFKEWQVYRAKGKDEGGGQKDITVDKIRDMEKWVKNVPLDFLVTHKAELEKQLESFK